MILMIAYNCDLHIDSLGQDNPRWMCCCHLSLYGFKDICVHLWTSVSAWSLHYFALLIYLYRYNYKHYNMYKVLITKPFVFQCRGNYIGVNPYVQGSSCSQCPAGLNTCSNKLCTSGSTVGECMASYKLAAYIVYDLYTINSSLQMVSGFPYFNLGKPASTQYI